MDALPFSREELLSQTAWLHSLARQLAAQPSDADDAAQQTWVQSLRAMPTGVRSWRPFLATTLRNIVALTNRAERRRTARLLAARADDGSRAESTADLVARIELHRHLAALVLELPDPQREFVLRHYFGGDTIAELAQRSGTTAAAIRGHLHRARSWLRQRLEVAEGDARRAFAALAIASTAPLVPAVAAFAMNTKPIVIAAVLVLAGLVTWQLIPASDPPPAGHQQQPAKVATAALGDADRGRPTEDAGALVRTSAERSEAAWVVRGELMHGGVAPLPGGSFTARLFAGGHEDGVPLHEAVLTSDASGAFEWEVPVPRRAVMLRFAQCRSDTPIVADSRTVLPGEAPPQDVRVVAFVKDCEVTGRVLDDQSRPIAGAWVKPGSRDEPTRCNADGGYRLMTSALYGDTSVVAGAPGHVVASRSVSTRGRAGKVAVDFALKPAARLAGRIMNQEGVPVSGALVYTRETRAAAATTGEDGRFAIPHVDPVLAQHTVQVEHAQYLSLYRRISSGQLEAPCELVLQRGALVRGRVLGPDGRGVDAARVRLGEPSSRLGSPSGASWEDGSFELRNAPPGTGLLFVRARGFVPTQLTVVVPAGEPEVLGVEVRLTPGHSISGRVTDRAGRGLHRIRISPHANSADVAEPGAEAYTARDGSFRLFDLPAGEVMLACYGKDVARLQVPNVAVDRHDVAIVMELAGRLAGRVVDDATGAPLTKFSIRFVDPELKAREPHHLGYGVEWLEGCVFEDAGGCWRTEFDNLEPGAIFGVEASAEGYCPAVQRRAIARPDPNPDELVLRLRKAARITGRVVDQRSGTGIEGARVAVVADPARRGPGLTATTDAGGAFSIEGVPAGTLSLVVRHAEWPLTLDGPFATVAGETTTRAVLLQPGARLTGTALDAHGVPVAGVQIARASVEVAGMQDPGTSTTTDTAGRFVFAGLSTARYRLHASGRLGDGSFLVWSRHVDVVVGNDVDVQLSPAGTGAIECELASEGRLPEAMWVQLGCPTGSSAEEFSVPVTGSSFIVRGLPAGEFRVLIKQEARGTTMGDGSVTVTAGVTAKVRIRVTSPRR